MTGFLKPKHSKDEGGESWDYLKTGIKKKKTFTKWEMRQLFSKVKDGAMAERHVA